MSSRPEILPAAVHSVGQVRELDRIAIDELGVSGYELMCRAGEAALGTLLRRWPLARRLAIYCGAGNNAGDGYVLARLAAQRGYSVRVAAVCDPQRLAGAAALACRAFEQCGGSIAPFEQVAADTADVHVDALLGTGLDRPLTGMFAAAVARLNVADAPVLALDIPTGLHADTGCVLGDAVRAAVTITFVGLKQGLFLGEAPDCRGELEFSALGLPAGAAERLQAPMQRLLPEYLSQVLRPRHPSAHKGSSGRLLLVGGAPGTSGAIRLAAEAALRAGAGVVYVATHADSVSGMTAGRPELMCRAVRGVDDVQPLLELADAAVLGPGLGQTDWARELWAGLLDANLPLVVDADGLNLLAEAPRRRGRWILTPHPGEAARLLDGTASGIQADRRGAVRELARRYGAAVVLKGACSLVADGLDELAPSASVDVCDRGNPGMATAGMGDVLAGVLGALLAQSGDCLASARAGVLLHALAGDDAAARGGQRGTLAGDLMDHIRRWANPR